jgi:hypothetical protein
VGILVKPPHRRVELAMHNQRLHLDMRHRRQQPLATAALFQMAPIAL